MVPEVICAWVFCADSGLESSARAVSRRRIVSRSSSLDFGLIFIASSGFLYDLWVIREHPTWVGGLVIWRLSLCCLSMLLRRRRDGVALSELLCFLKLGRLVSFLCLI